MATCTKMITSAKTELKDSIKALEARVEEIKESQESLLKTASENNQASPMNLQDQQISVQYEGAMSN